MSTVRRVESILILGMASPFSPPSFSFSWLTLLWPFVGPSGEWVFSCVRSAVVKQSADELRCYRYVEVRKKVPSCFGSIGSFINDNERSGICLKVGLTTTSEWGSSSASSASLLTARLAPSVTKSIFTGCCCKLGLILFPFLLVARLCCLWPDLDHIHVGYRSHTKDILSPQGPPPS